MNDIVKKSNENGCEDTGLIRNCPICGKPKAYKFKSRLKYDEINHRTCYNCYVLQRYGDKENRKIFEITRNCPKCQSKIVYNSPIGCYKAKRRNSICNACAARDQYTIEKQKKMIRGLRKKSKSDSWAMRVAKTRKKNGTYIVTEDIREKHRINKINRMIADGTLIWPNYNRKACLIFDKLEKDMGWNGLYATKGKEKRIGRFWVDYYEPSKNIVIEYDEPYHYNKNGELRENDKKRQGWIEQRTGCKFFRININTKYEQFKNILLRNMS